MSSIDLAYNFYKKFIHDEERIQLLTQHNLKVAGSVPSVMWELFGAILTDRAGTGNTGADLHGWEVKSAKDGGSYEYQYHLNTGLHKLEDDCRVNHLFCRYSETYADVTVYVMRGPLLAGPYFENWRPMYIQNYNSSVPSSQRRQRFRKSIPSGFVHSNGQVVLKITNSLITFRDDNIIPLLNSEI